MRAALPRVEVGLGRLHRGVAEGAAERGAGLGEGSVGETEEGVDGDEVLERPERRDALERLGDGRLRWRGGGGGHG